jgi:hypothetical protein
MEVPEINSLAPCTTLSSRPSTSIFTIMGCLAPMRQSSFLTDTFLMLTSSLRARRFIVSSPTVNGIRPFDRPSASSCTMTRSCIPLISMFRLKPRIVVGSGSNAHVVALRTPDARTVKLPTFAPTSKKRSPSLRKCSSSIMSQNSCSPVYILPVPPVIPRRRTRRCPSIHGKINSCCNRLRICQDPKRIHAFQRAPLVNGWDESKCARLAIDFIPLGHLKKNRPAHRLRAYKTR